MNWSCFAEFVVLFTTMGLSIWVTNVHVDVQSEELNSRLDEIERKLDEIERRLP